MDIPKIGVNNIQIRQVGTQEIPRVYTPEWLRNAPTVLPATPPVTQQIGVPIINMPGCVEAHEGNTEDLKTEDPKGVRVFCDAGVPNFNPIDYDKNKIEYQYEQPVPPYNPPPDPPETPPTPEIPKVPPTVTKEQKCPTEIQEAKEPVGSVQGDQKIVEYKLIKNGDNIECVPIKVKLSVPDQVVGNIPTAGAVTATASIAVVATTSALLAKPLADLLLKVIKPTIKKVMKKIATMRGKTPPIISTAERRAEQRERYQALKALRMGQKKK
nr:hypothetical protein [uncultured Mediterranean phage uvMED]|tara:strand:- start:2948 stop:3757 length:810 start_codon:yes stop_codon:yes gene_type:complete